MGACENDHHEDGKTENKEQARIAAEALRRRIRPQPDAYGSKSLPGLGYGPHDADVSLFEIGRRLETACGLARNLSSSGEAGHQLVPAVVDRGDEDVRVHLDGIDVVLGGLLIVESQSAADGGCQKIGLGLCLGRLLITYAAVAEHCGGQACEQQGKEAEEREKRKPSLAQGGEISHRGAP